MGCYDEFMIGQALKHKDFKIMKIISSHFKRLISRDSRYNVVSEIERDINERTDNYKVELGSSMDGNIRVVVKSDDSVIFSTAWVDSSDQRKKYLEYEKYRDLILEESQIKIHKFIDDSNKALLNFHPVIDILYKSESEPTKTVIKSIFEKFNDKIEEDIQRFINRELENIDSKILEYTGLDKG